LIFQQVGLEGTALLSDSDQRHKQQKIDCGWSWKCNWSAISLHFVINNTLRALQSAAARRREIQAEGLSA
jgi:hypothetical protein